MSVLTRKETKKKYQIQCLFKELHYIKGGRQYKKKYYCKTMAYKKHKKRQRKKMHVKLA